MYIPLLYAPPGNAAVSIYKVLYSASFTSYNSTTDMVTSG